MPHYEYNTSKGIHINKNDNFRIFLCLLQYSLCSYLFMFDPNSKETFLGFFINSLDVALNVILTLTSIMILYKNASSLKELQKKIKMFGCELEKNEIIFTESVNSRNLYWFIYYLTMFCIICILDCTIKPVNNLWGLTEVVTLYVSYLLNLEVLLFHLTVINIFKHHFHVSNKYSTMEIADSKCIELIKINDKIIVLCSDYLETYNLGLLLECAEQFSFMIIPQYWMIAEPLLQGEFLDFFMDTLFMSLSFVVPASKLFNNVSYAGDVENEVR